ncbi:MULTISPECIES: hypothetical protein [unclassified Paenibacillus]|jgi:hypothetical protein|uniref:hypothetical protein n=1 Tax=unclassified Paenibacillus TaxID=185978 RepID=UPI0007107A34|nr:MULTISPECIES: hypothetical protein [unclassified Paenibacillus]KQX48856.1 hypothetical protein ASD40_11895 [Paenibacillus sp. Root444D2]KRE36475.1 hypothetical protein ASG85_09925 [Paenibacillus sp. Soil724D2]
MNMARIGILRDKQSIEQRLKYGLNSFGLYAGEVISHAGIPFEWIDELHQILENTYDLILIASAPSHETANDILCRYAERGGIIVSFAGLNGLARQLGFTVKESLTAGYAQLPEGLGDTRPLRFLGASTWVEQKQPADACKEWGTIATVPHGISNGPLLQQFTIGLGKLERWSVDVIGTIVGLQQGTGPVLEDGKPASDGTGNLNDGLLKAEDGIELDWEHDRKITDTGKPYFAHPYADLWREVVVAHILRRMIEKQKHVPFSDYWPEGVDKVAMISHDSDRNFDEDAITTIQTLEEAGIHSSWCMMKPGYSAWLYERIEEKGHELALHFNANINEGGRWDKADFNRQYEWLRDTVQSKVTSNKNHFTRFEGWGELFQWCEECGIESDQTRGPSKLGAAGFLFGTCQPYYPMAWSNESNRLYDVLEIGFLTQDIPQFTDASVIVPFLEEVEKVRGVAHFLFHQGRIHRSPEVREALLQTAHIAKERGFTFWTGRQINNWERKRRQMRITGLDEIGNVMIITENNEHDAENAVFWRPMLMEEEQEAEQLVEQRFGVKCVKLKRG